MTEKSLYRIGISFPDKDSRYVMSALNAYSAILDIALTWQSDFVGKQWSITTLEHKNESGEWQLFSRLDGVDP